MERFRTVQSRSEHSYVLTRWLFLRLLGLTYLFAFASLWPQIPGLIGRNGILPAADFLQAVQSSAGSRGPWLLPTLGWLNASDGFLLALCGAGMFLSLLLIVGLAPVPALALLWVCYLSLVNIGQDFLSFQWDILLLETGFLAIFFAPMRLLPGLAREAPPSRLVLWLLRLLLFRLMFFSGVVKLRGGDPTWRGLTALGFHYETQPLPTPIAWYAHRLPSSFHTFSTALVFVVELVVPFLIFAPRKLRFCGALLLAGLQLLIMLTGNYAFFNFLTIVLCIPLLDDEFLRRIIRPIRALVFEPRGRAILPRARLFVVVPLALVVLALNAVQFADLFAPAAPVPGPIRALARVFDPFHITNSYGLFAVMTTSRPEIVVEGSADGQTWAEYQFFDKPGDPRRAPPWVAPHQPRLDWQMWFAALGGPTDNLWFSNFMLRLLQGSPQVLGLLQTNPFPHAPPRYVRASLYDYHFTDGRSEDAAWWRREPRGMYFPPVSLE
jgi:uncharacterized membrane protein YphA (DoxX/SURF4 family)